MNLKTLSLISFLTLMPYTAFAQGSMATQTPKDEPWGTTKLVMVTGGAILGGFAAFTISEILAFESVGMEMGQPVVSDMAEHSGIKSLFTILGSAGGGYGFSQLYDSYSQDINALYTKAVGYYYGIDIDLMKDHMFSTYNNVTISAGDWLQDCWNNITKH